MGWVLAPPYDLLNVTIINPEDTEELALTVDGKKKKLKKEHFEKLAKGIRLTDKQKQGVFKRMVKNKPKALGWIDQSFLADELKTAYKELINSRYAHLIWRNKATSEMMQLFYSKWLGGMDKRDAFRLAQQELKKKKKYSEPYYLAGFVMVD